MRKPFLRELTVVAAVLAATRVALAAEAPASGLFQITSGSYKVQGGIWGELQTKLPTLQQAFVSLSVSTDGVRADLKILEDDRQTARLALTDGVVSGSVIRFRSERPDPRFPDVLEQTDYTVANEGPALTLNGTRQLVPVPCCDIPAYFEHANVVAVAVPAITIRVSEVELCWLAAEGIMYQVQSCADLAAGSWTNLGPPRPGNGGTLCFNEKVPPKAPQTYYRIVPALNRQAGVASGALGDSPPSSQ